MTEPGGATGKGDASTRLEAVFRAEHGRLLAVLAGRLGDLDLAEEVAAEALAVAAQRWPRDGVPSHPFAWLVTTARRKAVDRLRRDRALADRLAVLRVEADPERVSTTPASPLLGDEQLDLFLVCCHPALDTAAQTALTLRYLAGLTTQQVADAFLVPTATMAQRLTRAKRKIREARIPFRRPAPDELDERLTTVQHVLYLLFTEGWASAGGEQLVRPDLLDEAVRLTRLLLRLMPGDPGVEGLLALMLLTDARRGARLDAQGRAVPLEDQDRSRWDAHLAAEGDALLTRTLTRHPATSWSVQAAIAAVHVAAPSVAGTDWHQVVLLYDELLRLAPGPVAALGRAVAVGWHEGPVAGLGAVEMLSGLEELVRGAEYHAARAHLLARLGRGAEAAAAYRAAAERSGTPQDRAFYLGRGATA